MGIGQQIIGIYNELFSRINRNEINNVCELGRQNLAINNNIDPKIFKLFSLFNKNPPKEILGIAPQDNWGVRAKILYEGLGIDYFSIDIDNEEKNEDSKTNFAIDLNFSSIDKNLFNKFNLVTNFGTSEHIFNQLNFFKTMHDLTSVNGYMISEVPCMFGLNHGMYKYEPKFFTDIARSNAYNIIGFWVVLDPPSESVYPWSEQLHIKNCSDMSIITIMQKTNNNEFCVPLCGNYEMKIKDKNLKKYNYNVDGLIISGEKTKYILRNKNDISHLKKEVLFTEIFKRFKRKIGLS